MFLFVRPTGLNCRYVRSYNPYKRQSNGVIVACQEDDSDTIYACDSDMCYPVLFIIHRRLKMYPIA